MLAQSNGIWPKYLLWVSYRLRCMLSLKLHANNQVINISKWHICICTFKSAWILKACRFHLKSTLTSRKLYSFVISSCSLNDESYSSVKLNHYLHYKRKYLWTSISQRHSSFHSKLKFWVSLRTKALFQHRGRWKLWIGGAAGVGQNFECLRRNDPRA